MTDAERKFELLKMARQLVHDEYINRRAQEHNAWVAQNAHAIRTTRKGIAYPPFTRHPTEADIIARATALYQFIAEPVPAVPVDEPLEETVTEVEEVEVEEELPEITEEAPAAPAEDHVLPGWIKGWIRTDR